MSKVNVNSIEPETGTTLTLGAASDTIDIPSGATLDVTGATVSGLSAGKVLQVVSTTDNTAVTVSSGALVELSTNFRATITPSSTSSKILVLATLAYGQMGGVQSNQLGLKMMRDGTTQVGEIDYLRSYDYGSSGILVELIASKVFLDSPATTSAIIYSWYGNNGTGTQVINDDTNSTNITLLEIGV
jgi:hypothetical protein